MARKTRKVGTKKVGTKKTGTSKDIKSCCSFMEKHWPIITGIVLIIALIIIIIVFTTKSNTNEMFSDSDDSPAFVMFHVPWCGYCKKTMPVWKELQSSGVLNSKDSNVKILDINCEDDKEMAKKHKVDGFPTIKYFPNGLNNANSAVVYDNERDLSSLKDFINKQ